MGAGVAIQRQMLLEEFAHMKELERDLSLARDIQQRLLPTSDPQIAGYDVAGWNEPADATGGDCYDFVYSDDGRLGVLLADVTGHGIGPALIVAECRALIRAVAAVSNDLGTIMSRANRLLNNDLSGGRFSTTFFGWLDPIRHDIQYLSAGHGPLLHYVYATGQCRELPATTYPMGILPEIDDTPAEPIEMAPGDIMVLVTDGFYEWPNPGGEQFGIGRVNALIHAHRDRTAAEIIQRLHSAVEAFGDGTPQRDDLTAVVIRRVP